MRGARIDLLVSRSIFIKMSVEFFFIKKTMNAMFTYIKKNLHLAFI
jgi:hypothetical protein